MKTKSSWRTVLSVLIALSALGLWSPAALAKQVELDVGLGNPVLVAGQKQTTYLRVSMEGFEWKDESERPPVNVAIVLDKSGSMQGDKIEHAKRAAIMAIDRLRADDIVSVIVYDHTVRVVVPATKVSDRNTIRSAIRAIQPGGNTALFAGVSKGASEIRKFLEKERVSRVILLSDGLANTGPSSPSALADLGTSLMRERIAVTTIGLGLNYNEQLMADLAEASDGNHYFAETPRDLDSVYAAELGDVLSVVAQEVDLRIRCAPGIRPVRVLGRDADIDGQNVHAVLNQLYSGQSKYVMLEVEVPAGTVGAEFEVARVNLTYDNAATRTRDELASRVSVTFTESPAMVAERENKKVMASAFRQVGLETNETAMRLRDEGKTEEAREMLKRNGSLLITWAGEYGDEQLRQDALDNKSDADNLDEKKWVMQRKIMKKNQFMGKQGQEAKGPKP